LSRDDLLSRINWPEVSGTGPRDREVPVDPARQAFWAGLAQAVDERRLRRTCFQLTASPGAVERAEAEVRGLHALRPALPICVSVAARDLEEIERILRWGAERVTIALDAATPELHREVKGGPLEPRLSLLREAARRYPGRIGTHLIAGLGETERDLVTLMGEFGDLGVAVALFAFTPIPGTRLEGRPPPDLAAYRRAQAARYLMASGYARAEAMTFDGEGRLVSSGIPWEKARALLASGEAFRTSGCPDCNRPYYNERPSGPLYNYPRPLTATEAEAAVDEARPFGVAPAGELTVGEPTVGEPSVGKPHRAWRLIIEESPRPGAENMAVDEAILLAHAAGRVPPTARFYRWTPPAVSLGYFQDYATDVDPEACRQAGIDIVRRTTGGRAVLHDQEVTYSIVVDMATLPGSVVETYRRIAGGLVFGLRALGLDAVLAPEKTAGDGPGQEAGGRTAGGAGPATGAPSVAAVVAPAVAAVVAPSVAAAVAAAGACFEVPSSYEILVGGKKIVGSAQVRRGGVILQHGSIPLRLDPPLLARVLGFPPESAARIATKAVGLEEVLGPPPGYADVCRAVSDGLAGALEVTFEPGDLTPEEAATAEGLVREKYSRETWNKKRPEKRPETEREES
jgi:lipoate-protein ligase A/biotin synthase-related radical SAM superfamily protein